MADFSALKTAIQANIRTNGNEEITGAILQEILLSMVSTMGDGAINALSEALQAEITNRQNAVSGEATTRAEADSQLSGRINAEAQTRSEADTQLGNSITAITTRLNEGYVYAGIATPSTNPGTPAGKVFYIALQAGTYTNFSSLDVTKGINILKYNGTAWSQDNLLAIDNVPKKNGINMVTSGGIFANIGAFDISEYHKSDSTLATYADLTAALAALPSDFQKGGMSIKFVQSSDNKYVQYRLMADTFNTTVANWQGVDDEPTDGSNNLVKSRGVALSEDNLHSNIINHDFEIRGVSNVDFTTIAKRELKRNYSGVWEVGGTHIILPINDGFQYFIKANSSYNTLYSFLSTYNPQIGEQDGASLSVINAGTNMVLEPSVGSKYLYIQTSSGALNYTPNTLIVICSNKLDNIKNVVTDLNINGISEKCITFKYGVFFGTDPITYTIPSLTRLMTDNKSGLIKVSMGDVIGLSSYTNAKFLVAVYSNSNGSDLIINTGWLTADYTIEKDGYMACNIAYNDNSEIEDIRSLTSLFKYTRAETEKALNIVDDNNKSYPSSTALLRTLNGFGGSFISSENGYINLLLSLGTIQFNEPVSIELKDIKTTSNTRICSRKLFYLRKGAIIHLRDYEDGYQFVVGGYKDKEGTEFITSSHRSSWSNADYKASVSGWYGIVFRKGDNLTMNISEIETISNIFAIYSHLNDVMQEVDNSLWNGNNIIGDIVFEQKMVDAYTGLFQYSATRVLSQVIINKQGVVTVDVSGTSLKGYIVEIQNGSVTWRSDWFTTLKSKELSPDMEYYLMFAFNDNSNIVPSDILSASVKYIAVEGNNIITINNPKETVAKLLNLKKNYNAYTHSPSEYRPILSLLWFSDIHGDNENMGRIKQFADNYPEYINDKIVTGDISSSWFDAGVPSGYSQISNTMMVIGNHDTNRVISESPWEVETVDEKTVYDVWFAPYISGWNVVQPANAATEGYLYYYKDYADSKIRLIVLDKYHADSTQFSWFADVLSDAITEGYHVVCAIHEPPFASVQDVEHNTFTSINMASDAAGTADIGFANAVKTFIQNGGNFICWLCGHIHDDVMGLGPTAQGFDNQLSISIAGAAVGSRTNWSEMATARGTKLQDCFNIIGFDTNSKTIKIVRVGADYDCYLRKKNTLSWNYETNQLIYCD